MTRHNYHARWSDRETDPDRLRAQVNIRLHPARRDELDELARLHQVTRSRMMETLIQTAWQETQGQIIDPATIDPGEIEQPAPSSNRPATGQAKSREQVFQEMERDGVIVGRPPED